MKINDKSILKQFNSTQLFQNYILHEMYNELPKAGSLIMLGIFLFFFPWVIPCWSFDFKGFFVF